jgi:ankyrin repeat protein
MEGADLNLTDNRGRSALITAAKQNHSAVYDRLLRAGADSSLRDQDGLTAADWLIPKSTETLQ